MPFRRRERLLVVAALPVALLCVLLTGCGTQSMEGQAPAKKAPTHKAAAHGPTIPTLFSVPEEQLSHLRITAVRSGTWPVLVQTTGTVDFDADHTTQAITQVSGPITRILVDTGAMVKTGDPLLYVASPDITNAISAYRKAVNHRELTRRVLERNKELMERGAIALKDLESAEADYNDALTDVQTSLQALRIYGITQQGIEESERQGVAISPQLAVRSPITGMVVQKLVAPGQLIQAGATTCFLVSDMSTVWVQGHIFDRDLASVRVGDLVDETSAVLPGVFHGVVSYIGAMVDPATRTTPIRIVTKNPGGLLKKDLFVDATIHTRSRHNVLFVPTDSVLHDPQNQPFVYVEAEPGSFAQRLVTVGGQMGDQTEISSGLREGERVVSEGSVFLQFANTYQ